MTNRPKKNLGERELDIMQVLWRLKTATVADVLKALEERGEQVAYTTVQTMLNRLEAKKLVGRNNADRVHRYRALLEQPSATDSALKRLTQRFFDGSIEALVTRLVEKDLTEKQIERVQSLIDEHRRKKRRKR